MKGSIETLYGIDFSGNYTMWTPGCGRSNVWIATARAQPDAMSLVDLQRGAAVAGGGASL